MSDLLEFQDSWLDTPVEQLEDGQFTSLMVTLLRRKYADEGARNFQIGRKGYERAVYQRNSLPAGGLNKYNGDDFDNLCNDIRSKVRPFVNVAPKSIQVGTFVRCYLLRKLVADSIGEEDADRLSYHDYRHIQASALQFSKKDVTGEIVDGWMEFIREIASARASGQHVSTANFEEAFDDHAEKLKALAATAGKPEEAAAKLLLEVARKQRAAVAKANEDITTSISNGLSQKHVTGDQVVDILKHVAGTLKIDLPISRFDPAKCTTEDCTQLAQLLFNNGKIAEMVHLRDKLDRMIATVKRAHDAKSDVAA